MADSVDSDLGLRFLGLSVPKLRPRRFEVNNFLNEAGLHARHMYL